MMVSGAKRKLVWVAGVATLGLVATLLAARQTRSSIEQLPSFRTEMVSRGALIASVQGPGKVNPTEMAYVTARTSGAIVEVLAEPLMEVQAGQILARLDRQPLQIRRDTIAAELAEARAERKRAAAQVEVLRARQEDGEVLSGAKRSLKAELKLTLAQLDAGDALIARHEAMLRQAELDLAGADLRSPIDGIIVQRQVERGQAVSAAPQEPPLFIVAHGLRLIEVPVMVEESAIGKVKPGQEAEIRVPAHGEQPFRGRVKQVRLLAQTGQMQPGQAQPSFMVTIEVPNEDLALLPGMSAQARIITERRSDIVRVPNEALRWQPVVTRAANAAAPGDGRATTLSVEADNPAGPFVDPAISANGVAWFEAMKDDLALTPEQVREVSRLVMAMRHEVQAAGTDAAQRREVMRAARLRFNQAVEPLLTEPQRQTFRILQEMRRNRAAGDRRNPIVIGRVHVLDDRGMPRAVTVRLGVSDGRFTEVLGDELSSGDVVVVDATTRQPAVPRPWFRWSP